MEKRKERAVAVGLNVSDRGIDIHSDDTTLAELAALIETAGGEVVLSVIQNRETPDPATFIGAGKAAEIRKAAEDLEADIVVFDNELSPSQMKNLEAELDLPVLDRTGIILDIFASRAFTAEGKLQVELAQYKYLLPRLSGQGKNLSRQGATGGNPIGTRGPGETKLETDRRHIRERIAKLRRDADDIRRVRGEQRRRREKNGMPLVALVGYTNAGKSTILNLLTGAGVSANNRLFDTLDPTTRVFKPSEKTEALLTDTVGFIRDLPHHLVDAFRATLEELSFADLVLIVSDISDENREEQTRVTEKLVSELCGEDTPRLYVLNKADLCPENVPFEGDDYVCISARTGENVDRLLQKIAAVLEKKKIRFRILLPYGESARLDKLYKEGAVAGTEYTDNGIIVEGECDDKLYGTVKEYGI
ncbi:MAG: GTPase HflX [Clostridia bacterium]|nr:GTPase HflX [Clostridia bacterium]